MPLERIRVSAAQPLLRVARHRARDRIGDPAIRIGAAREGFAADAGPDRKGDRSGGKVEHRSGDAAVQGGQLPLCPAGFGSVDIANECSVSHAARALGMRRLLGESSKSPNTSMAVPKSFESAVNTSDCSSCPSSSVWYLDTSNPCAIAPGVVGT